jgi:hypothetical protein
MFCSEHGVEPAKSVEHFEFEYDLPKHPLELRAPKERDYYAKTKPTGRVIEFERTEAVERMENMVRELNSYFAKQTLRSGSHHGYVRIFSNGDDPDFAWDKGGRFYRRTSDRCQAMVRCDLWELQADRQVAAAYAQGQTRAEPIPRCHDRRSHHL